MLKAYCCLIFFVFSSLHAHILSATDILYLTWQSDPTTTMTISWLTELSAKEHTLEYCQAPNKNETQSSPIKWTKEEAKFYPLPENAPHLLHRVECKNLLPNTLYCFRITGSSDEHLFQTMPKTNEEPIRFIVAGDLFDKNLEDFEKSSQTAAKHNPRFVLLGGDIAYSVSDKHKRHDDFSRWNAFLTSWTKNFKTTSGVLIPMLAAIGNHEVKGYFNQTPESAPFFYTFFPSPNNQGYQVIRFGEYLSTVILDSGHTHQIAGAQTAWIEQELKKQIAIPHRFVIYHVPAFPCARYFRSALSSSIRRNWCPLFETYGIHAAFENHDHAFKRTFPLINSSVDRFGVVYMGDGGFGVRPRIPKNASRTTYLAKTKSTRQFIEVEITKSKRIYRTYDPDDLLIDIYEQEIGKPSPIVR